jgi:hypothetical protein
VGGAGGRRLPLEHEPALGNGTLLALVVDSGIPVLLVGSAKEAGEAVERIMLRIAKNGIGIAA